MVATIILCQSCGGSVYKGRKSNYIKVYGGYRHEDWQLCRLIKELTENPVSLEDLVALQRLPG